jgi:hypothetical protein
MFSKLHYERTSYYSITSSTRTRKDFGITSASAFAVLRLTTNSILDGSSS